jgi:hypothetical protein
MIFLMIFAKEQQVKKQERRGHHPQTKKFKNITKDIDI